jgi:serine/threonine protein kinase
LNDATHRQALPSGYALHWYVIEAILGQGGFGITYLGRDSNLGQKVAVKEFFPTDFAVRDTDCSVHPSSTVHTKTYNWGLDRFLAEAQTLAKFRHPNIVRVLSVFEANNTAYMVMEYEQGKSLEEELRLGRVEGETDLLKILLPLLDGLECVHQAGFIHRDIKPQNIFLRADGVPVVLDFGSARQALGAETRMLTTLVSPGYAPFEQYHSDGGSDKQGPWTDIYALGATLYRALSGRGPVDGLTRANALLEKKSDPMVPAVASGRGEYSTPFLEAIDWSLNFYAEDRPQSTKEWRLAFARPADPPQNESNVRVGYTIPVTRVLGSDAVVGGSTKDTQSRFSRHGTWLIAGSLVLLVAVMGVTTRAFHGTSDGHEPQQVSTTNAHSAAEAAPVESALYPIDDAVSTQTDSATLQRVEGDEGGRLKKTLDAVGNGVGDVAKGIGNVLGRLRRYNAGQSQSVVIEERSTKPMQRRVDGGHTQEVPPDGVNPNLEGDFTDKRYRSSP